MNRPLISVSYITGSRNRGTSNSKDPLQIQNLVDTGVLQIRRLMSITNVCTTYGEWWIGDFVLYIESIETTSDCNIKVRQDVAISENKRMRGSWFMEVSVGGNPSSLIWAIRISQKRVEHVSVRNSALLYKWLCVAKNMAFNEVCLEGDQ